MDFVYIFFISETVIHENKKELPDYILLWTLAPLPEARLTFRIPITSYLPVLWAQISPTMLDCRGIPRMKWQLQVQVAQQNKRLTAWISLKKKMLKNGQRSTRRRSGICSIALINTVMNDSDENTKDRLSNCEQHKTWETRERSKAVNMENRNKIQNEWSSFLQFF